MLEFIKNIDISIFIFINHLPHPAWLVNFLKFFSWIGNYALIWFILMLLLFIFFGKKEYRTFLIMLWGLILTVLLNELLIKNLFLRSRPQDYAQILGLTIWAERLNDYSFMSGHAFSSFACAYILGSFNKKYFWPFMALALLISFSRVYLGYHWPADVIAGAISGLFLGWVLVYIGKKLKNKKKIWQKKKTKWKK